MVVEKLPPLLIGLFATEHRKESHGVCANIFNIPYMYLPRKLEDAELMDLLVIHTNRFTNIMVHGETYIGEYKICMRTIEFIQKEIFSRNTSYHKSAYANSSFTSSIFDKQ